MNKVLQSVVAASLLGLVSAAYAQGDDGFSYTDWAKVTQVTPQYERINTPRRECSTEIISTREPVYYNSPREERSLGGAVIGGVTGGIVGHQVGKGRGKTAATAVGAVIGALVGDRIDNDGYAPQHASYYEPREQEVKRCRLVDNWENRVSGYQVDYVYDGHQYSRLMSEDPGRKFKVRVSVEPE